MIDVGTRDLRSNLGYVSPIGPLARKFLVGDCGRWAVRRPTPLSFLARDIMRLMGDFSARGLVGAGHRTGPCRMIVKNRFGTSAGSSPGRVSDRVSIEGTDGPLFG